ncbi:uncharacterized protein PGTG_20846 [Puccinia graminis f. sp. tritici CRL 75-36-700-3]|uniref:Uncharacterized protein n=1 Tax=Puccinia graminis f. sp. tritici (strain CRL 75-36-700-3 / race SCCL) TaxID=418459 RepID=H6QPG6_PUCGT|nr:uncharacterized protein PGTG_20846 [Puccinia graminis f. sp. tritici CRL 75-36-700-3]EHS63864.1 hypothetical protein PGTG_20846 [Puccinia graminis f. sp. tritici CRL 75-36-700-3]
MGHGWLNLSKSFQGLTGESVRTGDDNQSCKPLVELSAISFGGKLESWSRVGERTDHAARFRSPNSGRFCWVNEIGLTTSVARERPTDSQTVLPTALQPTRSVNLGGWGGPQCTIGHITWPFSHCGPPHPPTNGLYRGWRIVVHPGWFHNHPPTENVARWCSVGKKSAPVPRRICGFQPASQPFERHQSDEPTQM